MEQFTVFVNRAAIHPYVVMLPHNSSRGTLSITSCKGKQAEL